MRDVETGGAGVRVEAGLSRGLAAARQVPQGIGAGDLRPALDALRRSGLTPAAAAAVEWLPALAMAWIGGVVPADAIACWASRRKAPSLPRRAH